MSRKKQKRYSIRLDRIAIVLVAFILIIVLIVMLFKSCSNDDSKPKDTVVSQQNTSATYSLSSFESAIERLGFEKRSYSINDIHYGELILVNNDHEYIFDENKLSDNIEVSTLKNEFYGLLSNTVMSNYPTIQNFNNLMKEYYTQFSDSSIAISSGYRSKLEQDLIYTQAVDNNLIENPAGFSDNHTGYSLDLVIFPEDSSIQELSSGDNYSWLVENCSRFGFIQRYPEDKKSVTGISNESKFRYVSVPHSMYIYDNNLCLEEYISMLNNYKFGVKSLRYTYNEQEYMIYLCEATSNTDTVEVYVPKDKEYTICGNNVNGFIVTVKL